jgi:nucleoid-associated protein YgaU
MATIILGGQLRPAAVRTAAHSRPAHRPVAGATSSRRAVIRDAARTREVRRVYRRRRFGVMTLVAVVAVAATFSVFSLFGSSASAGGTVGQQAPKYVVVQAGDTLWSIGERIAPNAPITEVVDELVRLNGTSIQAGQLIRIP